jgi:hypothetical protein
MLETIDLFVELKNQIKEIINIKNSFHYLSIVGLILISLSWNCGERPNMSLKVINLYNFTIRISELFIKTPEKMIEIREIMILSNPKNFHFENQKPLFTNPSRPFF